MALLRGFWVLLVLLPSFFQPQVLWLSCNSRSPCSSFPPEHLRFKKFLLFFIFVGWVREFSLGRSQRWHFQGNLLCLLLSISDLGFVQLFPFNIPRNCFCRIIVASCSRPSPLTCTNSWITVKHRACRFTDQMERLRLLGLRCIN